MNTQTKYTPGPWKTNELYSFVRSENLSICEVSVNETTENFTFEEWKANAKLIAAAPELLEALKALVLEAIHYKDSGKGKQFLESKINEANTAITKATE